MEPIDGTIHAMSRADLGKAYHCTNRTNTTCYYPSKIWVDGRPYCLRCGRRAAKVIAECNARNAELNRQLAALREKRHD
jgi:hypothetical protein